MARRTKYKYVIYDPGDKIDAASEGDIPPPRDLVEQMYCSEQIHIPPTFPYILRQYCKAAIRTQPYDLLKWSTAYFRAMATGDVPPVKFRLEYPPTDVPSGLTPGYLRVILRQLKRRKVVPTELLYNKWGGLCLNHNALLAMLEIGQFDDDEVDLLKFVAIAAGHLTNTLKQTMIVICEILTEEPEGGSAMIPYSTFCDLYTFLAKIDCGPPPAFKPDLEETVEAEEEEQEEEELDKTEDKLSKQPSLERHAEGIISDIVDTVVAISPGVEQTLEKDDQGEGEEEASRGSSEKTITDEQISDSKEVDEEDEEKPEPPEDTAEVHEETDQVTDTNGEAKEDNVEPHEQASLEEPDRTTSVKFKMPENADSINTEGDAPVTSDGSSSATMGEEKSSEMIAKETVKEVVRRAEVAAEANQAEITAAQFLIKVKSETLATKSRKKHTVIKEKPKPTRVHHEVLGIGPPVSDEQIDKVLTYLHYWSARQEGMIMPRNINHFLCPPLDAPPPPEFLEPPRPKCVCGVGDPMSSECRCALTSDY